MKKFLILFFLILIITGYTPYTELNDLALVDMIGLEKQEDTYFLYLTTILPEKEENETTNQHLVSKFTGKSLGEVFLKAKKIKNKTTYYDHLKEVLLHTSLLEDSKTILTYLKQEFTQPNFLVLSCVSPLEGLFQEFPSSNKINKFVKKEQEEQASIQNMTFVSLYASILDEQKTAYLPVLSFKEETANVEGLKILNQDIILDETMARIHYLLNKKIKSYHKELEYVGVSYEVEVTDITPTFQYQNGKITIQITGKVESSDARNHELASLTKKITKDLTNEIQTFYQEERSKKIDTTPLTNTIYLKTRNKEESQNIYQSNKIDINVTLGVNEHDE